ncbi:MAG: tetratricopeptide repeat protein [Bryobacterales bacterium]|nr:tetratricopeptide repeat protein [Bryobacterales bacterium]
METKSGGSRPRRNSFGTATPKFHEAITFQADGRLKESEDCCADALRLLTGEEKHSLEAVSVRNTLASIRLDRGKFHQARQDARRALEIAASLGEPGADTGLDRLRLTALCLIGRSHLQAGELDAARPLLERALTMAHYWLPAPAEEKLKILTLLGATAKEAGHRHEAEEYYRKALAIAEQLYDPYHGEVASLCHRLALLSEGWDEADHLEPFARRAYEIRSILFGTTSPMAAGAQAGIALAMEAQGQLKEAGEKFLHSLSIFDRHYAGEQCELSIRVELLRDYALCRRAAAGYLISSGRHTDAREFSNRAQRLFERILGKSHPLVAKWRKDHDAIRRATPLFALKGRQVSAWDWWRGFSFSR